jgi:hypothetical protein
MLLKLVAYNRSSVSLSVAAAVALHRVSWAVIASLLHCVSWASRAASSQLSKAALIVVV